LPITPATATKEKPFENSLGMRFVPVIDDLWETFSANERSYRPQKAPTEGFRPDNVFVKVLFSIWETRSKDYAAFVKDSGHDAGEDWKTYSYKGVPVGRGEGEGAEESSHPVANVSHDDGVAFCEWLTKKDRASGLIGPQDEYRLPTDTEWSYAVGIGEKEDASTSPKDKSGELTDIYPWGGSFTASAISGNYADATAKEKGAFFVPIGSSTIPDYTDNYATTAPVGMFKANNLGLYDLGGNLWEWTSSEWQHGITARVLRGGSWFLIERDYLASSYRLYSAPGTRKDNVGFRCVVVVGSSST
jgi:formylglycine-generating enzyme required for sulfatase activity